MAYTSAVMDALMEALPREDILARYEKAGGNELSSGKFSNPESSAALVANTFGFFLHRAKVFPALPGCNAGWPATSVLPEAEVRCPWNGGMHPWLDAVIETETHIVGVESKRYEPFRSRDDGTFSDAYSRPVWGDNMGPFEWLRDGLAKRPQLFQHVDGFQLIKHAFGLRTEAQRKGKSVSLVYLYAEPKAWHDGRTITPEQRDLHAEEVRCFARLVKGAEVGFSGCTYHQLLDAMKKSAVADVREHAGLIAGKFDV